MYGRFSTSQCYAKDAHVHISEKLDCEFLAANSRELLCILDINTLVAL